MINKIVEIVLKIITKEFITKFLTATPITLTTVSATLVGINMLIDNLRDVLTNAPPLFLGALHMYGIDFGISLMLSTLLSIEAINAQKLTLSHLKD